MGVLLAAILSLSVVGQAQSTPGVAPPAAVPAATSTLTIAKMFPSTRSLAEPPAVPVTGVLTLPNGTSHQIPISPATAVVDLQFYDYQLQSLFSPGVEHYPDDSVRAIQRQRATAWLDRLRATNEVVRGRALLSIAEVAFRAEQDSLARVYVDRRLAELPLGRPVAPGERSAIVEQSLTLGTAILLLSDPDQPYDRLGRNASAARVYLKRLLALPVKGYSTHNDSDVVAGRKSDAIYKFTLAYTLWASDQSPAAVAPFLDFVNTDLLGHVRGLDGYGRAGILSSALPWRQIGLAVLRMPDGHARLQALKARVDSLATYRASEWPADWSETRRRSQQQRILEKTDAQFAFLTRIEQPLPALRANAWLNTPDSAYSPTPKARSITDGIVRVIAFGRRQDPLTSTLDLIQRQFAARYPGRVQVVYVTETDGHAGPDVVDAPQEIAWLVDYYLRMRHFTMPIAIWAGPKVPGENGTLRPTDSETRGVYLAPDLDLVGYCTIVDGAGKLRGFQELRTLRQRVQLIQHLERVLADTPRAELTPSWRPPSTAPAASGDVATATHSSSAVH